MINPHPIGELEINALVDGELTGEAADDARRAIEDDEGLEAVAIWGDTLNRRLHSAFDGVLARPMPTGTSGLLQQRSGYRFPSGARRLAAAAAIAAIAAGIGYFAGTADLAMSTVPAHFAQLALGAHQVYASEVRHPVEVAGADQLHLGQWLSKRLDVDFAVPDIKDTGFVLLGGRLLAEGERPAALLMYEDATGHRITLYIEKSSPAGGTALRYTSNGPLAAYYWIDSPLACAISGDLASDQLKAVAQRVYTELEKS